MFRFLKKGYRGNTRYIIYTKNILNMKYTVIFFYFLHIIKILLKRDQYFRNQLFALLPHVANIILHYINLIKKFKILY